MGTVAADCRMRQQDHHLLYNPSLIHMSKDQDLLRYQSPPHVSLVLTKCMQSVFIEFVGLTTLLGPNAGEQWDIAR